MGSLPQFAVLTAASSRDQRRRRLLTCSKNGRGGLSYSQSSTVEEPTVQYAIERSSSNNQLVHIRCGYNNKYVVRRTELSMMLVATAEEQEEDTSLWSCTAFRPELVRPNDAIYRFRHLQSGMFLSSGSNGSRCELLPEDTTNRDLLLLDVVDWSSVVILPRQVVFKGNNGRYLGVVPHPNPVPGMTWGDDPVYTLQFSISDAGDASIKHELNYLGGYPNGTFGIKSLSSPGGLTLPPNNGIWVTSSKVDPPFYLTTFGLGFTAVKVNANTIGIRSQYDNFLRRDSRQNYLYEDGRSLTQECRVQVEEPVLSREIYNVRFRFEDARIYDQTPIVVATDDYFNRTDQEHFHSFRFSYEERRERSWRAFISLELGLRMRFRSGIPIIGRLGFDISATFNGEYEWGESDSETLNFDRTSTYPIPPRTHVTAHLVATRGTCDIPFDYSVRDVLTDGTVRNHEVEGGVYTGINNFNFTTDVDSEPIV